MTAPPTISRADLDRAQGDPPARSRHPDAVRRRRDPGGRLPQARRGPAGHVPARVRRGRRVVLALVVRRRGRRRLAVGRGRPGGVDGRGARGRADRRRPAAGARRGVARAEGPPAAGAAAAHRRVRRLPRLRRGAADRDAAGQGGRRSRPARADHAARHRSGRGRPLRVHRRADRQRDRASRDDGRRARRRLRRRGAPPRRDAGGAGHAVGVDGRHRRRRRAEGSGVAHAGRAVPAVGRARARGDPRRRGLPDPGRATLRRATRAPTRSTSTGCCAPSIPRRTCTSCAPRTSTSSAAAPRRWSP